MEEGRAHEESDVALAPAPRGRRLARPVFLAAVALALLSFAAIVSEVKLEQKNPVRLFFFCLELPGVAQGIVFGAKSVRGTLGSGARLPQAFALRAAVLRLRALCCHGYRGHRHATVRRQRWRVVQ